MKFYEVAKQPSKKLTLDLH